jgi:hypothetical protein
VQRSGFIQRKTPLVTRTAIVRKPGPRPKRDGAPKLPPQERMRDGKARPANAAEGRHMDRLAKLPCFGCRTLPSETKPHVIHHVMKCPPKVRRRDHRYVVQLCVACHDAQHQGSVHWYADEAKFCEAHGRPNMADYAIGEWLESNGVTTAGNLEAAL